MNSTEKNQIDKNVQKLLNSITMPKLFKKKGSELKELFNSLPQEKKNEINKEYTNVINELMIKLNNCISSINKLKESQKDGTQFSLQIKKSDARSIIEEINSLLLLEYEYIDQEKNKNKLKNNISLFSTKIN